MKRPRIDAFVARKDKVPVLKSSLDDMPVIEKPILPKKTTTLKDEPPTDSRIKSHIDAQSISTSPSPHSKQQPGMQTSDRSYVRRTFDFYEEQIKFLKSESLKEQLAGLEGSMNAMVREAIDDWIKKEVQVDRYNSPPQTDTLIHSYMHTLIHSYTHTLMSVYTHTLIQA